MSSTYIPIWKRAGCLVIETKHVVKLNDMKTFAIDRNLSAEYGEDAFPYIEETIIYTKNKKNFEIVSRVIDSSNENYAKILKSI